eukprot:10889-Pelagomonas_calceolata.AAC.5
MPGIRKCEELPLGKKQTAKAPHKPASDITAPTPCQFKPSLKLKVGSLEPTQAAAAKFKMARQLLGQACTIL